jgi:hypothetical protein
MPHTAVVLERVLRFFYPGTQPVVETLGQLREILEVLVDRYNVESVVALGQMHLRVYIVSQPVGAFAVAARQGWNDLALEAAKECLKLPLRAWDRDPPEELRYITGTLYQRLIQYHYRCGQAAKQATSIPSDGHPFRTRTNSGGCICDGTVKSEVRSIDNIRRYKVPQWFTDYLTAIGETLAVTPSPLDDPLLLMRAVDGAANCPSCRLEINKIFPAFLSKTLWPKIQSAIAKVCFNTLYPRSFINARQVELRIEL